MTADQLAQAWPFVEHKFVDIIFTGGKVTDVYLEAIARNDKNATCLKLGTGNLIPISTVRKISISKKL